MSDASEWDGPATRFHDLQVTLHMAKQNTLQKETNFWVHFNGIKKTVAKVSARNTVDIVPPNQDIGVSTDCDLYGLTKKLLTLIKLQLHKRHQTPVTPNDITWNLEIYTSSNKCEANVGWCMLN